MEDPFLLRSLERLVAVVIGGLAIWLGFRLFLAIPDQTAEGQAELQLAKDRGLLVTRIGPGVFFALFGTAIVVSSYFFGVERTTATGEQFSGFAAPLEGVDEGSPGATVEPLDVGEARAILAFLDEARFRLASGADELDRNWDRLQFENAKVQVALRAWQPAWGDSAGFDSWLREEPPRSVNPRFERALAALAPGE